MQTLHCTEYKGGNWSKNAQAVNLSNECMLTLGWAFQNELPFEFVSFFPVIYLLQ